MNRTTKKSESLQHNTKNNQEAEIMKNIEMKIEGNELTIKVDITKRYGKSSSGKNIIIASTEGNQTVDSTDIKVGLNVYVKADD